MTKTKDNSHEAPVGEMIDEKKAAIQVRRVGIAQPVKSITIFKAIYSQLVSIHSEPSLCSSCIHFMTQFQLNY